MVKQKKKILLGITGSIAAYKSVLLVREATKMGFDVRVMISKSGQQFVTPLTLEALSKNRVSTDLFDREAELSMSHIELAKWADLILIAPATANIISKMAYGITDDLISTVVAAKPKSTPLLIAPAMNVEMYNNPANLKNIKNLQEYGFKVLDTDKGSQACGDIGLGRMLEVPELLNIISNELGIYHDKVVGFTKNNRNSTTYLDNYVPSIEHLQNQPKIQLKVNDTNIDSDEVETLKAIEYFKGKHILVTAGPTREMIDPVRYITNHSSGKMGVYIAALAKKLGAKVTLVCGPISVVVPEGIRVIKVESAVQMDLAVQESLFNVDCFIGCAAVSDFRAENISTHKIKKSEGNNDGLTISLVKNPDILYNVSHAERRPKYVVGFAAETRNVEEYAKGKVLSKGCDCICANDVSKENQGWNSDYNQLVLYKADGSTLDLGYDLKEKVAKRLIIDIAKELYKRK